MVLEILLSFLLLLEFNNILWRNKIFIIPEILIIFFRLCISVIPVIIVIHSQEFLLIRICRVIIVVLIIHATHRISLLPICGRRILLIHELFICFFEKVVIEVKEFYSSSSIRIFEVHFHIRKFHVVKAIVITQLFKVFLNCSPIIIKLRTLLELIRRYLLSYY